MPAGPIQKPVTKKQASQSEVIRINILIWILSIFPILTIPPVHIRKKKKINAGSPNPNKYNCRRQKDPEFDIFMKKAAVMDAFDEV